MTDDLISRQAAISAVYESSVGRQMLWGHRDLIRTLKNLPSAQPERKVGKWNWDFANNGWADWTCSICGWKKNTDIHVNLGYNYCPNCGARMKGEEDDSDKD